MATTNENIVLGVDIKTGNAVASFKSLKAEARALEQALASGKLEGEAFTTAARRAGELKDRIKDAKDTVNAFNPEAKFQAFAGVLGGVANGFAVAQGAAALFGGENEDVEKAILKTQSAIAIATGLNGLLGMKDAFMILSQVIKTQVVTSFNTLGKAIKSTGIIALVATLGVLIYQWYQEKLATDAAAKSQEKLNEQIANYSDKIKELRIEGARGREKEALEQSKHYNDQLREVDKAVKEEVYTVQQGELLKSQIRSNYALADRERIAKESKEDRDKRVAAQKELSDALIEEANIYGIKTIKQKLNLYGLEVAQLKYEYENKLISKKEFENKKKKLELDFDNFQKQLAQAALEREQATLSATAQGLNSISNLLGENAAANKSLGVASATIDTYVGATKAYAQGGTLGFVSAAAIVLAGLANVKRILSVKIPKSGGAGNQLPTLSGGGAAPNIPQQVNGTRLSQETPLLTRETGKQNTKVYVLESDMTDAQRRVKGIKDKATIG
jgi:hypothetical protein